MRGTRMAYIVIGACFATLAIVASYTAMTMSGTPGDSIGPWYGRGSQLAELPYEVVVGPVDARSGIDGVLDLGMSKSALRRSLGQPLVPGLSDEEATKRIMRNSFDADSGDSLGITSFTSEFYGGVFAWVRYDASGRVGGIYFNPAAFRWRLRGTQRIIVSCRGNAFIVDESTSQAFLVRSLKLARPPVAFDVVSGASGDAVVVRGTPLRFAFGRENQKLKYVSLQGKGHVR